MITNQDDIKKKRTYLAYIIALFGIVCFGAGWFTNNGGSSISSQEKKELESLRKLVTNFNTMTDALSALENIPQIAAREIPQNADNRSIQIEDYQKQIDSVKKHYEITLYETDKILAKDLKQVEYTAKLRKGLSLYFYKGWFNYWEATKVNIMGGIDNSELVACRNSLDDCERNYDLLKSTTNNADKSNEIMKELGKKQGREEAEAGFSKQRDDIIRRALVLQLWTEGQRLEDNGNADNACNAYSQAERLLNNSPLPSVGQNITLNQVLGAKRNLRCNN